MADGPHGQTGFTWLPGDALRPEEVVAAARGVSLIVHAVNPPGYRNWGALVLPMLDSTHWFSQGLIKPGRPVTAIQYPGQRGIGHQWAYLPDVAETMVRLVEREEALETFSAFHMKGHWDGDGTRMIAAIRRATGRPDLKVRAFPWWLLGLASPFVPLFRELKEMRYLWKTPVHMDNARLLAVLGTEPHTPLDEAVRTTLVGLGCLGGGDSPRHAAREANTAFTGA